MISFCSSVAKRHSSALGLKMGGNQCWSNHHSVAANWAAWWRSLNPLKLLCFSLNPPHDAACWAASPAAEAIAEVLARVLSDDEFHRERRAAGLERARRSASFTEVAEVLLGAYEQADV